MIPNQKGKKPQKHSKPNKVELFNYYHQFISGLLEKIYPEIAQKVLQKCVFVLPSCLVVSGVMYTLKPLQNQILKLEIFTTPNWIPLCLVSSHIPWGLFFKQRDSLKGKKKEKRTSSRFSDSLKGLSLLFPIYKLVDVDINKYPHFST